MAGSEPEVGFTFLSLMGPAAKLRVCEFLLPP